MRNLELKVPPLAVVVVFACIMWLIAWLVPAALIAKPSWWFAVLPAFAGGLFTIAGVVAFRRAKTTVNPTEPLTSSTIVTTGVYRWSRNPMYVGFVLLLLSWALYLGNLCSAVLLPLFVLYMSRYQIVPEERALNHKFGNDYVNYMQKVRRWL